MAGKKGIILLTVLVVRYDNQARSNPIILLNMTNKIKVFAIMINENDRCWNEKMIGNSNHIVTAKNTSPWPNHSSCFLNLICTYRFANRQINKNVIPNIIVLIKKFPSLPPEILIFATMPNVVKSIRSTICNSQVCKSQTKRRIRSRFIKSQNTSVSIQKSFRRRQVATKIPAHNNSKTGYIRLIFFLQYAHFPHWTRQLTTGTKFFAFKICLHSGHCERPKKKPRSFARVIQSENLVITTEPSDQKMSHRNIISIRIQILGV